MRSILGALAGVLLTASIAIAAPPAPSGTIAIAAGSDLSFGGSAIVETTTADLPSQGFAYTSVVCLQGVGNVVYQWSQRLDMFPSPQTYPLIDQEGQGLDWLGGAAECEAWLIYRVKQGKSIAITVLDTTTFSVTD